MGKGNNGAIKGQLVVDNQVTGETMRVPLGAPRAKQWSTADAATQYIRSLVGADHAEQLEGIRVNDVPITECHNLASIRQQGGIMNVTALVKGAVEVVAAAPEAQDVAPMETEIDGLAVNLKADATQADFEKMTPLERMLSVPESQWLY